MDGHEDLPAPSDGPLPRAKQSHVPPPPGPPTPGHLDLTGIVATAGAPVIDAPTGDAGQGSGPPSSRRTTSPDAPEPVSIPITGAGPPRERYRGLLLGLGVLICALLVVLVVLVLRAGGTGDSPTGAKPGAAGTTSTEPVPVTTPPAGLAVVVGNGSGIQGRAKATAEELIAAGYTAAKGVDGVQTTASRVMYVLGAEDDAAAVAEALGLTAVTPETMPNPIPLKNAADGATARVVVLVGPDFNPAATGSTGSTGTTGATGAGN